MTVDARTNQMAATVMGETPKRAIRISVQAEAKTTSAKTV